jgi:hypothetical protein
MPVRAPAQFTGRRNRESCSVIDRSEPTWSAGIVRRYALQMLVLGACPKALESVLNADSAMTGMFATIATAKLREVFGSVFQTKNDARNKDAVTGEKPGGDA